MAQTKQLINRMQRRLSTVREKVESLMVNAANQKAVPILHADILTVVRNEDIASAATIFEPLRLRKT